MSDVWQVNDDGRPIALPVTDPYAWACVWDGKGWRHVLRTDITISRSEAAVSKAKDRPPDDPPV